MRNPLNLILNLSWFFFGGALVALVYVLAGVICYILIITIPFGVAAFRLANDTLWPFGRTLRRKPSAGVASGIGNVIWFVLFGWWLALGHISLAIAQFAGQNAARARPNTSWPASSIQKPCATMNHRPAAKVAMQEPSRMRRPPMRSV